MTPEQKLSAFLSTDGTPSRDLVFSTAVMTRVARRRAWLTAAASLPWALVVGVMVWALRPLLGIAADSLGGALVPVGAILTMTAALLLAAREGMRRLPAR